MTETQLITFAASLVAHVEAQGGQMPENALILWGAREAGPSSGSPTPETVAGVVQGLVFERKLNRTRGFERCGATYWVALPVKKETK